MEALSMDWLILGAVTFAAALAQAATGFGFAIVAVPLYLLVLNSHAAVQLAIVVTPVISLVLLRRLGRFLDKPLLRRLVMGTALGLPLGMAAFQFAALSQLKIAVAMLIVFFAVLFLVELLRGRGGDRGDGRSGRRAPPVAGALITGLISGAMTTSLGMPGPPVVLYFSRLGLDKDATRATILILFLFSYAGAIAIQAAVAGISLQTWKLAAAMVPCVLAGSLGGHTLSRYMSQNMFRAATLLLLLATGLYMLYATLFRA